MTDQDAQTIAALRARVGELEAALIFADQVLVDLQSNGFIVYSRTDRAIIRAALQGKARGGG